MSKAVFSRSNEVIKDQIQRSDENLKEFEAISKRTDCGT